MDFNFLKKRSIFSPVQPTTSMVRRPFNFDSENPYPQDNQQPDDTQGQDEEAQRKSRLSSIFDQINNAPTGPAQKQYKDLLASQPDEANFKPGKMTRLAAILTGGGEGLANGAAAGQKAAQGILSRDYDKALEDYKFKADRLSKGSEIEEKTRNNNIKTYRDFVTDETKQREEARKAKLDQANIGVAEARAKNLKNQGWTSKINASTGVEEFTRINPDTGQLETKTAGKMGLTPTEQNTNKTELEKSIEGIRQPGRMAVAAVKGANAIATQKAKFEGIKGILEFKRDNPDFKPSVDSDGMLWMVNPKDPSDTRPTGIDTGKMSDEDKIKAGIQGRKDVKAAPGPVVPDKTTTTKIVDGQKIVTTKTDKAGSANTDQKPAPTGFKPGGTWKKTSKGVEYYVEP